MWGKHDWEQFYDIAQRGWQRRPPPWPVAPAGANRVPAGGRTSASLNSTTPGINQQVAERLGLPVDYRAHRSVPRQRFGAARLCYASTRQPN